VVIPAPTHQRWSYPDQEHQRSYPHLPEVAIPWPDPHLPEVAIPWPDPHLSEVVRP
jgi:hypothetical protein